MEDPDLIREDGTRIEINDRIQSENDFGTVKYIGEVPPTKGVWLGVDWDDSDRGKHNGTNDGKQYFTARHATSGSFVRPKKVVLGVTCFTALKDRYGKMDDKNAGVDVDDLFVQGPTNKRTVVEMIGAEKLNLKQSKMENLLEVVLTNHHIYGAGPQCHLQQFTPNIKDLDISKNLISSWHEVAKITRQLPHLNILNVSNNSLSVPDDPHSLKHAFSKVQVLCVNRMNYTWQQILQCSSMFPSLEQLHASFNHFHSLATPTGLLLNVTMVDLECNDISEWDEMLKLADMPALEKLLISENNIGKIYFPRSAASGKTNMFRKVKLLAMNNNKINDWLSINELNKLRSLSEITLKGNPLLNTQNDDTIRQLLIAKIGRLQICQKTQVLEKERRGAEIDYLKRFGTDWVQAGGSEDPEKNHLSQEFMEQHPRYIELVKKLGAAEESEMKEPSSKLKDNLLHIKITCPEHPDKGVKEKKLPQTMIVQKLKTLVKRLFKIHAEDIILSYISQKMQGPEIELENELRQLSFYSMENGDILQVKW